MTGDWTGSYRLQLHQEFPLRAAANALPYLAALRLSHVYLSPCLQAVPGSKHGYDVTNPERVNAELGGESAWTEFVAAAKAHGLRILLDIVPNHMAAVAQNFWWDDLLCHGPYSKFADYFDIRRRSDERWRLHLPILAKPYGESLSGGELSVAMEDGRPRVRHYTNSCPISASGWGALLGDLWEGDPCFAQLAALSGVATPSAEDRSSYWRLQARALAILSEARDSGELGPMLERLETDPDRLDRMLAPQFYALHGWKLAGELCNYRRFFDVSGLVGMRTELPAVFDAVHGRVAAMIAAGDLDGLRIDHPDGLRDPHEYFERVRALLPDGRIYAEKILENDERLPKDWPIDGTVGYEFLAKVNRLWMDDQRTDILTAIYADFTGHSVNFSALVREKKRQIIESTFDADLERLVDGAYALAQRDWHSRDLSRRQLREALARVTTALPVYRTYRTSRQLGAGCAQLLSEAVQTARVNSPEIDPPAFDFLAQLLTLPQLDEAQAAFVANWQQLSPAVMAKGVEDTTFYCFDRLVSCNEVGAQASLVGISNDKFHEFCHYLSEHWPRNLLATSTHDNKRSEDVRTRISLLSEIPDRWGEALHQWSQLNAPAWQHRTPDRHAEYLLYQTMIGAWPIDRERCWQYMLKACREAKIATSWHEPNVGYEESIRTFVDGVFASPEFLASLESFVAPLVLPGRINSLAQTLIKLTAPGVPDFYQGTEVWDLSLVDPDNRRAVDFERRAALLAQCARLGPREVTSDWDSGLPKLWLIARTLALRSDHPQDFLGAASYQPLAAQGAHLGHLLSYQRGDRLISVLPRLTLGLKNGWEDTRLPLPSGRWRNCYGGEVHEAEVRPGPLFETFPVALLHREDL
jgi:(1->4)-alpha-D-glucan 1-alpha-D-glucosylmutase